MFRAGDGVTWSGSDVGGQGKGGIHPDRECLISRPNLSHVWVWAGRRVDRKWKWLCAFRPLIGVETNYVPNGLQAGFAGSLSPGSLFQDLGVGVTDGASYQLDLFVGSRLEGYAAHYLVQLFAGTTVIGSASGTIATGTGNFFAVQINSSGVGSGDLAIKLSETGNGQSLFDDVSLQIPRACPRAILAHIDRSCRCDCHGLLPKGEGKATAIGNKGGETGTGRIQDHGPGRPGWSPTQAPHRSRRAR